MRCIAPLILQGAVIGCFESDDAFFRRAVFKCRLSVWFCGSSSFGSVSAVIAFGGAVAKVDAGGVFACFEALLEDVGFGASFKQGDAVVESNVPAAICGESAHKVRVFRHAAAQQDVFGPVVRIAHYASVIYVFVVADVKAVHGGVDGADVNQGGRTDG